MRKVFGEKQLKRKSIKSEIPILSDKLATYMKKKKTKPRPEKPHSRTSPRKKIINIELIMGTHTAEEYM